MNKYLNDKIIVYVLIIIKKHIYYIYMYINSI